MLAAGVGPDGRSAATVDTGARFDMIGILFRSTAAGVRDVEFRLRVSPDRRTWTPWFTLKADAQSGPTGSTLSKADLVTEPVWVGAGRYVQYETETVGGHAGSRERRAFRLRGVEGDDGGSAGGVTPGALA